MVQSITKCPWCRSQFVNPTFSNCTNCGGTIEYQLNTNNAGSKPETGQRILPKKFIRRIKYTGNAMTMVGMIFTIVLFPTIIFPAIGIYLWKRGIKEAKNELIPLEYGTPVLGEIESIRQDVTKVINGRSPYIVSFLFEADGKTYSGNVGNVWTPRDQLKQMGEKIWIVYMPQDPQLSSIWPPLI